MTNEQDALVSLLQRNPNDKSISRRIASLEEAHPADLNRDASRFKSAGCASSSDAMRPEMLLSLGCLCNSETNASCSFVIEVLDASLFLNGGSGNDILAGGKNADVFKISKAIDTITDFSLEEGDQIAVDADKFSDLEILTNPLGALLSVSGLGQMVVTGISATTMEENFEALFVKYIAK